MAEIGATVVAKTMKILIKCFFIGFYLSAVALAGPLGLGAGDPKRDSLRCVPAAQLATIRPFVQKLFQTPDDESWCATFEANENSELWVQVLLGSVNAAYPYDDDPLVRLRGLGVAGDVEEMIAFEAGAYATFILAETSVMSSARFVDVWFSRVLAAGDDYTVVVQLEDLT
jgi:hypothetical protein